MKKGVRGVPEVKGSVGDPQGLRGASGVYYGVKGDARGVQVGQQGR